MESTDKSNQSSPLLEQSATSRDIFAQLQSTLEFDKKNCKERKIVINLLRNQISHFHRYRNCGQTTALIKSLWIKKILSSVCSFSHAMLGSHAIAWQGKARLEFHRLLVQRLHLSVGVVAANLNSFTRSFTRCGFKDTGTTCPLRNTSRKSTLGKHFISIQTAGSKIRRFRENAREKRSFSLQHCWLCWLLPSFSSFCTLCKFQRARARRQQQQRQEQQFLPQNPVMQVQPATQPTASYLLQVSLNMCFNPPLETLYKYFKHFSFSSSFSKVSLGFCYERVIHVRYDSPGHKESKMTSLS